MKLGPRLLSGFEFTCVRAVAAACKAATLLASEVADIEVLGVQGARPVREPVLDFFKIDFVLVG